MSADVITKEKPHGGDDGDSGPEEVTVTIGIAGGKTHQTKLKPGTTLAAALKGVEGYAGQGVRVDGKTVKDTHIMKDGEVVTVLPAQVRGGSDHAKA